MKGAGGTSGGIGQFFLGLIMMCGGFYMLFKAVIVSSSFGFAARLFGMGGLDVSGGMVLVPFMIGVGMVFYNARNYLAWLLVLGALAALVFGVITSVHLSLSTMSAFDLLVILVLAMGGLGLFLGSLRQARVEQ